MPRKRAADVPAEESQPGYRNDEVLDTPHVNSAVVGVDYDEPAAAPAGDGGFDPGEHTVAEVKDYLEKHPDESDAVLAAEAEGKGRTSLAKDD